MIAITGANGFVGRALVKELVKDDVVIFGRHVPEDTLAVTVDLTKNEAHDRIIEGLPDNTRINCLIHLAGVTPWSDDTDYAKDMEMAKTVAAVCNDLSIPRLLYMSGWVVYDTSHIAPYNEDTPTVPNTPYGKSKLETERYLAGSLKTTQLVTMRAASIYGPGQTSPGLIGNLASQALAHKNLTLQAKETRRDYVYIDDVIGVIRRLTESVLTNKVTSVNLGGGKSYSVSEVAETISDVIKDMDGFKPEIKYADSLNEGQPPDNLLSLRFAQSLGLLEHLTTFKEGIRRYLQWRIREDIL